MLKAYHPSISLHARHFLLPHFLKNTVVPVEKFVFELNSLNAFNANLTVQPWLHPLSTLTVSDVVPS
jgi:hypothetical protein